MFPVFINVVVIVFMITVNLNAFAQSMSSMIDALNFTYDGHLFFNATTSAQPGARYLLNQQLSNLKVNLEMSVNKWSTMKGLLVYNTQPTPIAPRYFFDQLFDLIRFNHSDWVIEGGKNWLNFGRYKSNLIYKPLTKALSQTNALMISIGYDADVYTNVSLFMPKSRIITSYLPVYYNIDLGLRGTHVELGMSYIHSMADSQIFQYNKGFGGFAASSIYSHVPGIATYAHVNYKHLSHYLTFVAAIKPFQLRELNYQNKRALPKAFSIQSTYSTNIRTLPIKLIGFYEKSFQTLALKLPKQRIGLGLSGEITPHLTLQFQGIKDYAYSNHIISTALNRTFFGNSSKLNIFALQAVLNF